MVDESLLSDLDVVDYLELFNNTIVASQILGISQSSCSRRYRAFSDRCGIGFDRVSDSYQATANLDVLASLRQASQKLRVRQGGLRICVGWQLGAVTLSGLDDLGTVMPIRSMNSWRMLSLLEQRLVDVALIGLMEFEGLLRSPLARLRSCRIAMSATMLAIPLLTYNLRLLAHCQHPLQDCEELDADLLSQFPAPALRLGMAPALMAALQVHGLANRPCGLNEYDQDGWEGLARDGVTLTYAAPHRAPTLCSHYNLKSLSYELGICECIGLLGHRDVLSDASFPVALHHIVGALAPALNHRTSGIQWLS